MAKGGARVKRCAATGAAHRGWRQGLQGRLRQFHLPAIRDVLGADIATDAVLAAWGEAYWMLADILISAEAQAYESARAA